MSFDFLKLNAAAAAAVVAASLMMLIPSAHAAAITGQGTWETTLQGRDLDGDAANGFEAYYDTTLDITWLADASYATRSREVRKTWDEAKTLAQGANVYGVTGWRLPDVKPVDGKRFNTSFSYIGKTDVGYNIKSSQSEMAHLYYLTLGNETPVPPPDPTAPEMIWVDPYQVINAGPFKGTFPNSSFWLDKEQISIAPGLQSLDAWTFDLTFGDQRLIGKRQLGGVWLVHSGDVAALVPEPASCSLMLLGLAVMVTVARWLPRRSNDG